MITSTTADDELETLFADWRSRLKPPRRTSEQIAKNDDSIFLTDRCYRHFDHPVKVVEMEELEQQLRDPKIVAERRFYPFLHHTIWRERYLKDKVTKKHGPDPRGPKPRPICYAAHHDALFFSWYSHKLDDLYEKAISHTELDECVLAYRRKGKNNVDFAHEVFEHIRHRGECVALAFDFSDFFGSLNHKHLKQAWVRLLVESEQPSKVRTELPPDHYTIYKAMTRYSYVENETLEASLSADQLKLCEEIKRYFYPKDFRKYVLPHHKVNTKKKGIPQGSPMSAVLSNLYMTKFDKTMQEFALNNGGIYRRYCDDMLFVMPQNMMDDTVRIVQEQSDYFDLTLNTDKTEIRYFNQLPNGTLLSIDGEEKLKGKIKLIPLQYLGLEFNGVTTRLRPGSLSRFHKRLKKGVRSIVRVAVGKKNKTKAFGKVNRRQLFERFTALGKTNFVRYALQAAATTGSPAIKQQVKNSIARINDCIKEEVPKRREVMERMRQRHKREHTELKKAQLKRLNP